MRPVLWHINRRQHLSNQVPVNIDYLERISRGGLVYPQT